MSSCPRPPRPLLVINDKGGEKCRLKACCCSASALSAQIRWNRFPDLSGTGFGVSQSVSVSLLSAKLGGTEFPEPVAPVLVVVCNRPL
jgi:hypothetical protein